MLARLQLLFYLLPLLGFFARAMGPHPSGSFVPLPIQCPNYDPHKAYIVTWDIPSNLRMSQDTSMNFTLSTSWDFRDNKSLVEEFSPPQGITLNNQTANVTIPHDMNFDSVWLFVYSRHTTTGKSVGGNCSISFGGNRSSSNPHQSSQSPSSPSFSDPDTSPSSTSAFETHSSSPSKPPAITKGAIAGIVIAILLSLVSALIIIGLCYKSRRKRRNSQAPLLRAIPFSASPTPMNRGPSTPAPRPWVTFYQPSEHEEPPEYPASVAGTTTMRESKPVLLDQRAQMDGWYQGDSFERMQQLENGRQRMQELIQQFRARGEREWGVTQDELRPSTGYVVPNLR